MMTCRQLLSVLFATLLLIRAQSAIAQDANEATEIVYVYSSYDHEIFVDYYEEFFRLLKNNLVEHDYELTIVDRNSDDPIALGVEFSTNFDENHIAESVFVSLLPLNTPLADLSPLLHDNIASSRSGFGLTAPASEAADVATGILFYSIGRCDLAHSYLNEIKNRDSENVRSRFLAFYLGNCALLEANYEAAIPLFQDALLDAGGDYYRGSTVNLAWTYLQLGREEEAFQLLDDAIEYYEGSQYTSRTIEALAYRAQLYALAFRFDEAIADMDVAIELDPDNPELYVQRGQIILLLYEWDRVLADYNHALELDPDYADAYYYRGVLLYTQAHRDEALPDFQRYLELAPEGDHAADAAQYIADIQRQLDALSEP